MSALKKKKTTKTWSIWSENAYNVVNNYEKGSCANCILANLMNNQWYQCPYTK